MLMEAPSTGSKNSKRQTCRARCLNASLKPLPKESGTVASIISSAFIHCRTDDFPNDLQLALCCTSRGHHTGKKVLMCPSDCRSVGIMSNLTTTSLYNSACCIFFSCTLTLQRPAFEAGNNTAVSINWPNSWLVLYKRITYYNRFPTVACRHNSTGISTLSLCQVLLNIH